MNNGSVSIEMSSCPCCPELDTEGCVSDAPKLIAGAVTLSASIGCVIAGTVKMLHGNSSGIEVGGVLLGIGAAGIAALIFLVTASNRPSSSNQADEDYRVGVVQGYNALDAYQHAQHSSQSH
ncbi:MAG: hypothetical protein HC848_09325 [Limnobacter sp.]|nr:hypothetical protein [Limnobacter sp.]